MDRVSKAKHSRPQGRPENRFKGRGKATQFKPGQSGNPGGSSQAQYLSKIYREILKDPKNRKAIARNVLRILTSRGMAAVLLLREMAERTQGKVKDDVNVNVSGTISLRTISQRFNFVQNLGIKNDKAQTGSGQRRHMPSRRYLRAAAFSRRAKTVR